MMRSARPIRIVLLLSIPVELSAQAGDPDYSFLTATGFNARVWSIDLTADGRIIAAGDFTTFQGGTAPGVLRLWPTGDRDLSFSFAGTDTVARTVACLPDGKVLVGGHFNSPAPHLVRLLENGTPDPAFDTGTGPDSAVFVITTLDDGRALIGGSFTAVDGQPLSRLARLEPDGSIDPTFVQYGSGFNGAVRAITVQLDGRVLVGGEFSMYDGSSCGGLTRLLPDGAPDPEFVVGTGANGPVWCIADRPDGGCIAGGEFLEWNGQPMPRLAHLFADGSLDNTFPVDGAPNGTVLALNAMPDDRILMGGMFTALGSFQRNRIARMMPNGELDDQFVTGSGFAGFGAYTQICDLLPDTGDRMYVAGRFGSYQDMYVNMLCRLNNAIDVSVPHHYQGSGPPLIARADGTSLEVVLEHASLVEIHDVTGRCVLRSTHSAPKAMIDLRQQPVGVYLLSVTSEGQRRTLRVRRE